MQNYQTVLEAPGEMTTSSSPGASRNHVNHTAWQGSDKAQKMLDISGRKCLEQFESAGRPGLWARTFLDLLIGQKGWFSSRCALTWKVKGTKYNRLYCQLQVSTLRTEEIESGLLPTCVSSDATTGAIIGKNDTFTPQKNGSFRKVNQKGTDGSIGFGRMVQLIPDLIPTPQTQGLKVCDQDGKTQYMDLGMLPTPTTREWKDNFSSQEKLNGQYEKRDSPGMALTMGYITGQTGQLSPLFVMSMMGFPESWLEI